MDKKRPLLIIAALLTGICHAQETPAGAELPQWNIKTNLLYDVTASLNLGIEAGLWEKTSLDISGNWNPWTFGGNRKWKHLLVQPELRFWAKERFSGFFWGPHVHYAYYNVGRLPAPPFSDYMNAHRFEGWAAGAGVSAGYRWNFSPRIAMEAVIGAGYAYLDYDRYECTRCGEKLGSGTNNYFGATKAAISLVFNIGKVKKAAAPVIPVYVPPVPVVEEQPEPLPPAVPQYTVAYVTPEVEAIKQRCEAGKAYLDFTVGRSEIVSSFRNNAAELDRLHQLIEAVRNNPHATITGITITGYASPEGTWASNMELSERRAAALKTHIKAVYNFREGLFTVSGKGEDWAGLDSLVSLSGMTDKYRILEIIRGTDLFDGRERKLEGLSGGNAYRQVKEMMFPGLRRTEYEFHYTVIPFTVEQGKEVIKTRPASLSLNEMFLVANTYAAGSAEFNEVFETAARIYPQSDTANLNAAASALDREDTVSAARYLSRVSAQGRNAAYHNNMGALYTLQGEYGKADAEFKQAQE